MGEWSYAARHHTALSTNKPACYRILAPSGKTHLNEEHYQSQGWQGTGFSIFKGGWKQWICLVRDLANLAVLKQCACEILKNRTVESLSWKHTKDRKVMGKLRDIRNDCNQDMLMGCTTSTNYLDSILNIHQNFYIHESEQMEAFLS